MTSEPGDVTLPMTIKAVADMAMFSKMLTNAAVTVQQPQNTDLGRRERGPPTTSSSLYAASVTMDRRSADIIYL